MSKYELVNDQFKDRWINKPNNKGDVGDLQDITDELNRLLSERDEARELAKEADLGHDMAISDLRKCETELAEATTKLAEISSLTESIVEKANALIARWDQPSWKDTAPTARFINALRIAVRAYEREAK
jgi:hypothetical protein